MDVMFWFSGVSRPVRYDVFLPTSPHRPVTYMSAHEFSRLSSYDFQELIRDLLQAEWRIRLESFTPGRDTGIDLRCLTSARGDVIVQCKHSPHGRFREFLSRIRRDERPKIKALSPSRYVLATSRGLTPPNKKQLAKLLRPYVKCESDILGRDDVNNLLRHHPSVETNNFKLWLTSAAVLDRVLHNAERCQTEFEVDRVCRKLPLFVQNEADFWCPGHWQNNARRHVALCSSCTRV
jgi:hypothetical protein